MCTVLGEKRERFNFSFFKNSIHKKIQGVCSFSRLEVDSEGLSEATKECLEMRLDPCVREAKRTTVMSIAYVPGNPAINDTPSIWCGMGSGAIMVYETDRWSCVSELRWVEYILASYR